MMVSRMVKDRHPPLQGPRKLLDPTDREGGTRRTVGLMSRTSEKEAPVQHPRNFLLCVPPHGGCGLTALGESGIMPDLRLLSISERRLYRSRLPDLSHISYSFGIAGNREMIQNFYHMGDFFVVSEEVLEAFSQRFRHDLEFTRVHFRHMDGSPAQPYFAVRVNVQFDCIDPEKSTWGRSYPQEPDRKFKDGLSSWELDRRCWSEFSNDGPGKHTTYPSLGTMIIRNVVLTEPKVPPDAVLFQAKFWPGHWIIDAVFAHLLERICLGGFSGYYFWTLDLGDVARAYMEKMQSLR